MIKKATIENFRSIRKLVLPDLSRINLIGGKNAAGKSSLLEALFLFYDRYEPAALLKLSTMRGNSVVSMTEQEAWAPIFNDFDLTRTISISVDDAANGERVLNVRRLLEDQIPSDVRASASVSSEASASSKRGFQPKGPEVVLQLRCVWSNSQADVWYQKFDVDGNPLMLVVNGRPETVRVTHISSRAMDPALDARRFSDLQVMRGESAVVEAMRCIEPNLMGLSILMSNNVPIIHADIKGYPRKVPATLAGDGFGRLLSWLLVISTTSSGLVLADEIENGFHYSVMSEVWKAIAMAARRADCQIFASTHSYECVRAAYQGLVDVAPGDLSYFRLDRKPTETKVQRYSDGLLEATLEHHVELR